uniref:Sugar ABC transporter permease n=1 Tax=Thermosporothrix sp. COM3 TaxID=2490863 RepID=A0A455SEM5_9CHLR|nr:sugar ABC transporter permease [Thermosporothrix sp. COM3]
MANMLISEQVQAAEKPGKRSARWKNDVIGYAFVAPFLIAYALFVFLPIILGFGMSFFNWSLAGTGKDQFLGLQNYQEALTDPSFWGSLGNTVLFTVISTPLLMVFGLVLALLANMKIPGRWLFRTVVFAPYILPVSAVVLVWNWLYQPGFGLINGMLTAIGLKEVGWLSDPNVAMLSTVIVTIWWTVGFNFVLYLAGLQQIPQEVYESASIDGANSWNKLLHITLPLLKNTTLLVMILQVISSLQVFAQIFLLTGGGPNYVTRPLMQYVYETGFSSFRIGLASAMSYLFFILIMLISGIQFFLFYRKKGGEA